MDIERWTTQAKQLISQEGAVPLIDDIRIDVSDGFAEELPTDDDFDLDGFLCELPLHNPHDIAQRCAVLNFLYRLWKVDASWIDPLSGDDAKKLRELARTTLVNHVLLRPVAEVAAESEIRWEIVTACAIADWERVDELFQSLARLVGVDTCETWRGQVLTLSGNPDAAVSLDSWQLHARSRLFGNLAFVTAVLFATKLPGDLTADLYRRVCRGVGDLEISLGRGALPQYASSMLGWGYAAQARQTRNPSKFKSAAEQYRRAVTTEVPADLNATFFAAVVECLSMAGLTDEAVAAARDWAEACPKSAAAALDVLGELECRRGDYRAAYAAMVQSRAANGADVAPNWKENALVAVGGAFFDQERNLQAMRDALARNPRIRQVVDGVLAEHWEPYGRLTQVAKEEWVGAMSLWFNEDVRREVGPASSRAAARCLAGAVEEQLRSRVFEVFREEARRRPRAATHDWDVNDRALVLYLEGANLTFGPMVRCVLAANDSRQGDAFAAWLRKYYGRLASQLKKVNEQMDVLVAIRNDAAHVRVIDEDRLRWLHQAAKTVLDLLVPSVVGGAERPRA